MLPGLDFYAHEHATVEVLRDSSLLRPFVLGSGYQLVAAAPLFETRPVGEPLWDQPLSDRCVGLVALAARGRSGSVPLSLARDCFC